MTGSVTTFPSGIFRLSRIVYIENLQQADSRAMPLGVIAEVVLPTLRGLAMAARTVLDDDELRAVGPLMRNQLETPFNFLEGEFHRAWRTAPRGEALNLLLQEHTFSTVSGSGGAVNSGGISGPPMTSSRIIS